MERIENPEKYQAKEPFKIRAKKFLLRYILWLPLVCLFVGLIALLLLYQHQIQNTIKLGVNYGKTVTREDYKGQKSKSRLQQFQDKIFEKDQVKRRGRYEHIVSGKDVVSVDFGQATYSDEEKQLTKKPQQKDSIQNPEPIKSKYERPVRRKRVITTKKVIHESENVQADSIPEVERSPFASIRLTSHAGQQYTLAYIYGDQEVEPGSFIKLRLGEPLQLQESAIPEGTVFTGKIRMSSNAINVKVDRIRRHDVNYEVYDADYSHGIIIDKSKSQDMEQATNNTIYRSAGRSVIDLPYEILQDVTQSIIRNKRNRQRTIKLNDGYKIYLAKG
ncbi:conjugative transposon protein TraM [Catalinimonas sp. 4WD22]|uniref:conjugative transposon protein TraM n=1 Tax=Catalinimonas locisalis TaxID=3133978 RepID=UPI003100F5E8